MSFIDFLAKYWSLLFGIGSVIFACGYTYFAIKQMEKDRQTDLETADKLRQDDRQRYEDQMKEQKKDHDERLIGLEKALASTITKVDSLKDEMFKVIKDVQLDIREIMTILKNKKAKK